jgi:hypothetical protein
MGGSLKPKAPKRIKKLKEEAAQKRGGFFIRRTFPL